MTTFFTQHVCAALIGIVLLTSCSRPVAYFQRSTASPSTLANSQVTALTTPVQTATPSDAPLPQIDAALHSVDAYVRNDRNLADNKKIARRLDRVKHLLTTTYSQQRSAPATTTRKLNVIDRLIIGKLNKKISRQLAPAHPEKVMVSNPIPLIGGIVLLLGGLLLLILGTGTGAFIGLILALIGALGVIVGLFGG
jgi:hypothetical protein